MTSNDTFDETLIDHYTDAELAQHFARSPRLITTREERGVFALSPGLVAKRIPFDEDYRDQVSALERARSVGVNVPLVRRILCLPDSNPIIIMDRIQGETLEQCWHRIGLWGTLNIAWQLRSFLRGMGTVTSQTTGGLHTGAGRSEWLQAYYPLIPHASPAAFAGYVNWWLLECRPDICIPRPELVLSPARQHVLVHQDLAPRNMILDTAGRLWLVDFGEAGFYPPFMEYLGMKLTHIPWLYEPTWAAWWGRMRWSLLQWIACGPRRGYGEAYNALCVVRQRSLRYRMQKTPFSEL
ncbi:hypothetical protein EWM64_g6697 [Hericium alpestre]|uniref:Aminoglycoside phosphotransferase domain-containing protein n=1 Tax=Hericium alpestre TaxID=135208 RepID=A0A4Y9ZRV5_9AGAM|nr:hypothetical protein EWM64_g6697 [Hericium alpestre]